MRRHLEALEVLNHLGTMPACWHLSPSIALMWCQLAAKCIDVERHRSEQGCIGTLEE